MGPLQLPASCFSPVPTAAAQDSAPIGCRDRIEDAPAIKPDPYPEFDNFAWRAFIALNWPSRTDPAHRGEPDRAKMLGDQGPRVWETFKARYEIVPGRLRTNC